jgi:TolB-like protein
MNKHVTRRQGVCNTSIFLTLLFAATTAFAINNVAVLELIPNESVMEIISIEEFRHLTDELRRQAVMTLPKNDYSVLTRDNLISLLPPDEKETECLAESCAVEIGRAIGAEYISQGIIGKFGKKLTISVELYETMSGKLLSSIVFESEDIDGLLGVIRNEAKPLFQNILDLKAGQSKPVLSVPEPKLAEVKDSNDNKINAEIPSQKSGVKVSTWVGVGLAVAGIGAGVYGILQDGEFKSSLKDYNKATVPKEIDKKRKDSQDAESRRNIGYIVGGVLLASGITIYFVF